MTTSRTSPGNAADLAPAAGPPTGGRTIAPASPKHRARAVRGMARHGAQQPDLPRPRSPVQPAMRRTRAQERHHCSARHRARRARQTYATSAATGAGAAARDGPKASRCACLCPGTRPAAWLTYRWRRMKKIQQLKQGKCRNRDGLEAIGTSVGPDGRLFVPGHYTSTSWHPHGRHNLCPNFNLELPPPRRAATARMGTAATAQTGQTHAAATALPAGAALTGGWRGSLDDARRNCGAQKAPDGIVGPRSCMRLCFQTKGMAGASPPPPGVPQSNASMRAASASRLTSVPAAWRFDSSPVMAA